MSVPRYKLHAYICGRGCIKQPHFEGWASLESIFQMRPDGCRYGVAERQFYLVIETPKLMVDLDKFLAWDFFEDQFLFLPGGSEPFPEVDPIRTSTNLDGLIMKLMHRYPS